MKSIVLLGAGGHARSILSLLQRDLPEASFRVLDIYPGKGEDGEVIYGVKVESVGDAWINSIDVESECVLAIGDNEKRARVYEIAKKKGLRTPSFVSSRAIVHSTARIAEAAIVMDLAYVGPGSRLEENVIVNTAAIIEHDCILSKHSQVSPRVVLCGNVSIGESSTIGAGAIIRDRVKLTSRVTVGMGASVVFDLTDPGTYVGVPARKRDL